MESAALALAFTLSQPLNSYSPTSIHSRTCNSSLSECQSQPECDQQQPEQQQQQKHAEWSPLQFEDELDHHDAHSQGHSQPSSSAPTPTPTHPQTILSQDHNHPSPKRTKYSQTTPSIINSTHLPAQPECHSQDHVESKSTQPSLPSIPFVAPPGSSKEESQREKQITQEEMDRFFGFVDPYKSTPAPPVLVPLPAPAPPSLPLPSRHQPHSQHTDPDYLHLLENNAPQGSEHGSQTSSPLVAKEASQPALFNPPYQLSPIPKTNADGRPLTAEERRYAIIDSLEHLALSVVMQLMEISFPSNSLYPTPASAAPPAPPIVVLEGQSTQSGSTLEPPVKGKQRRAKKTTPIKQKNVVVILTNRMKRAPVAASQESYADFEQEIGGLSCPPKGGLSEMQQSTTSTPTRQLVFPRKTAGTRPSCNGANLAQLVKTIELVLDGLRGNTFATKRDLYYRSVKTFGRQDRVDYIIEDLAATLQVRREDLNVLAASKGLFAGQISIITVSGKTLSPGSGEDGGGCLVPAAVSIERISCEGARWVLVVEKEAVFQSLCCPAFLKETMGDCPGVLVTGKGYPDVSTRELVKRLSDDYPSVPIFCLVDSDPHGLDILWTYKFGSLSLDFDKENLAVTRIQWLGVRGSEWDSLGVDREELLPLAKADRAKALKMLQRDGLPLEWRRELCYLLHLQRKAEIQVLRVPPNPNTSKLDLIQPKESLVLGEDLFRYVSRKLAEGGV